MNDDVLAPNLTQNSNEKKNSIVFLSSWQKEQWVPARKPILDLVTSLKQKARGPQPHAFLPVFAVCATSSHCATVRRASRGGGQRGAAPQWCPESPVPALKVSSGEHTAQLPSWNPSSDSHSSPTETRKPTDRSSKALCRSDVLVLLEERSWIVLTGRTWWRNSRITL